jgi:tetratricopeptide (TPR) repeat protein
VEKESRGITVTCQFELLDAAKHSIIVAYSGEPTQHFEKGKTSPFFGGAKTEADMTPRDKIIYSIVDDQLTKFLCKFVPTEIKDTCNVQASGNKLCQEAVKAMVVDDYDGAFTKFRAALAEDGEDHKALFGAGVCCEKLDKMPEALKYYKQARSLEPKNGQYVDAVQRVSMLMGA